MAQYIDKSAVVAEIERKIEERDNLRDEAIWNNELWPETEYSYRSKEDEVIIDLINTLEVKDVDLEKEIQTFSMELAMKENNGDWEKDIRTTAKHFFELGLKHGK